MRKNWEILKKVIKPKNVVVIILLLVANSFAWFIYATQVDNEMSARVRAWNVVFEAGDSPIDDYININIESMFPGMNDDIHEITAYNRSEVAASLSFALMEVNILGDYYESVESKNENGREVLVTDFTSSELQSKLANEYPFAITISVDKTELSANYDTAIYQIRVEWPFEGDSDEEDTYWGQRAAIYRETNPDTSCIVLKVKISIAQAI